MSASTSSQIIIYSEQQYLQVKSSTNLKFAKLISEIFLTLKNLIIKSIRHTLILICGKKIACKLCLRLKFSSGRSKICQIENHVLFILLKFNVKHKHTITLTVSTQFMDFIIMQTYSRLLANFHFRLFYLIIMLVNKYCNKKESGVLLK